MYTIFGFYKFKQLKKISKLKDKLKKIFAITKFDNENISFNRFIPFHKGRVKIKKEVVPIGKRLKKKS